jgi:aspartate aminotransferase
MHATSQVASSLRSAAVERRPIARALEEILPSLLPLHAFFTRSPWAERQGTPGIADLVAGNPHEPPLPEVVATFRRWNEPRSSDWYGYRTSDPSAARVAARRLAARLGVRFEPEDVFLTNGAAGGLAAVLRAIVDPGDEVVMLEPAWFFYTSMIRAAGGTPVPVALRPPHFELDPEAIAGALTARTRAVIVNTPHNPSGRVFSASRLEGLAHVLREASPRTGSPIHLISDEAYARIVFPGSRHVSPSVFYPSTFVVYTFTKTLLTPGQRLGYVAVPAAAPDREALRVAMLLAQITGGHAFPNGVLQAALDDLERHCIDLAALERKRDRVVRALRRAGYSLEVPEGTFYVLARSPTPDDGAFVEWLAKRDVFVLPGSLVGLTGYFRIALTATDSMLAMALPILGRARRAFSGG